MTKKKEKKPVVKTLTNEEPVTGLPPTDGDPTVPPKNPPPILPG